jgi:hypothetical protein
MQTIMHNSPRFALALFASAVLSFFASPMQAQADPARPELVADFTYTRSNAPVNNCGCFGLYGGSLTLAVPIFHGPFAIVGDAMSEQDTSITSNNYHLTLSAFTAGGRYSPDLHLKRLHPFAQAMIGVAHASQNLVKSSSNPVANASATLAIDLGGGVDLDLNRRFRVRVAQVSYLLTTFDNGSNNAQNNLRLDAGLIFRF